MPRNRSEKSISGDLAVDEYLRAFLRHHNTPYRLRHTPDSTHLRRRHDTLCGALTDPQHKVINSLGSDGALTLQQCRELFRHEREFASAP